MEDIKSEIRKLALLNAIRYEGKAQVSSVIGMLLSIDPNLKNELKNLGKDISKTVQEVNSLSIEQQREEVEKIDPALLIEKKKEERKDLPDLKNAEKGKVVTRIPPEPSKYNHIGHALSFLINYLYAKKYEGKCILRFEDTNPEKEEQEYVDSMKQDVLEYLDIHPDDIVFVSDHLQKYYELAEQLINDGKAYVCFCDKDIMKDLRNKGLQCEHRNHEKSQNLDFWKKMLSKKFSEGKATLRLLIDMESLNHVLRDPVIMRIVLKKHYRQGKKYSVWPMYDFENAIEEHLCGVTHILRSNEFGNMRWELQNHIKDLLKLNKQTLVDYGRFNVVGAITQGREIRQLIEEKKVLGWDDPRLVTLKALRRRGIVKESYYELVKEVGLSKTQTNIDFSIIAAINRRLLNAESNRYFFIKEPVKVTIKKAPELNLNLNLHPDKRTGGRNFKTSSKFILDKEDFDQLEDGNLYRLMECLNFSKKGDSFVFNSLDVETYKSNGKKIIHWLPNNKDNIKVEVLMPDATLIKGLAEPTVKSIKEGQVVQFERFGFCRLDKIKKNKQLFWYCHK